MDSASTSSTFNLKQILKVFIYMGLKNISQWDQMLEIATPKIIEQNDMNGLQLIELMQDFISSLKDQVKANIDSQIVDETSFFEYYILDPVKDLKIVNCDVVFNVKLVDEFKTYVKEFLSNFDECKIPLTNNTIDKNNSDFLKIFNVINEPHSKIQQIFSIKDQDSHKVFTSPGETGSHLIKIEISDVKEIANVSVSDRWRLVSKKAIFLIGSETDKKYRIIQDIMKDTARDISALKGVKSEVKRYTKKSKNSPY